MQRKVNDLMPLSINPRKISEAKRMKMIESIQRFNLVDIPVVDFDNMVVSGHQRLRAMQAIGRGEEEIDVRMPNRKLTDRELKDYNVLANSHFGEFDMEIFEEFFGDVDLEGLGLDLSFGVLDDLDGGGLPNNALNSAKAEEDDFEPPVVEEVRTDIVLGDLFEIGEHRLLCGDSTKREDVERVMGGELADLYVTDPPYGVSYGDKNRFLNAIDRGNRIQDPIANDHLGVSDCGDLWAAAFAEAEKAMSQKASYYIFSAQGQDLMMMMMMIDRVFSLKHCLIWIKNNHVLGRSDYNYKHEPVLYGWKKKGTHEFFGGFQTSVFEFPKPQKNDLHPTMKPVALIARLIENSTRKRALVLDSFLGSGTTMVAAHQLGRKCFGLELEPKYCQVILNRMLKLDPTLVVKKNGHPYPAEP